MIEYFKVEDFAQVITGGTPSTKNKAYWEDGHIPWLNSGELNQEIIVSSRNHITSIGLEKSAAKLMPKDSVLIALTGTTTGVVGYLTFEACANQSVTGILPSEKHFPKFLFYYLKSIRPQVLNDAYGGAQPHISQGYVKQLKIPLPPLEEQKKIAAILEATDNYRQKTKALIDKYDQLTQSLFLDMFGDPVTNPKGWIVVRFDQLVSEECPLTYGIVQPGDEVENGTPCVRPVDLKTQYVDSFDLKRIDPEISLKFKRTILKGGEILLSVRGSVGVISIAALSLKNTNVTRGIVPIWFDENLANKLFFYFLYKTNSIQRRLAELSKGATLIQLNLKDLRELPLIKPSLELQNLFAERVEQIEKQKQQAEASLVKAEELFSSLLQRAFKGELTS